MRKFISIIDTEDGESIMFINLEQIAYIHQPSNTIVMCGNHGQSNGVLRLSDEDMKKVMEYI